MKKMKSKLSVSITTLRELSSREMAHVQGGGGSHNTCLAGTCTCPPTYVCGTTLTGQTCV